jgi:hypothetical protein
VTGFPEASLTTPSMVELFSAARANWPQKNSSAAAKMIATLDRVPWNLIANLLVLLSICTCLEGLKLVPVPRACASSNAQHGWMDSAIRGVYAKSSPARLRFFGKNLREENRDWDRVTSDTPDRRTGARARDES